MSFKNTVLILTSNLGSPAILELAGQDKAIIQETVMQYVRGSFRPEFVNRIDEFIIFEALQQQQLRLIVRLQVDRVRARLAEKKIALQISENAEVWPGKAMDWEVFKMLALQHPGSGLLRLNTPVWMLMRRAVIGT